MISLVLALLVAGGPPPEAEAPISPPEDSVVVHQVGMVDVSPTEFAFEPTVIRARPGEVVRFVQKGLMPHNVEFREVPEGAELGDLRMGPFLTRKGEAWDLIIDERFVPGSYAFVCTPHEPMGMKATLIVDDPMSPTPEVHR